MADENKTSMWVRIAEIIGGIPRELFDSVKWRVRPDPEGFFFDLERIARDIIEAGPNSLVRA